MLYRTKLDFDCGLFLDEYENLKHNEKVYESPRGAYAHWKVIRNEDMTSKIVTDFTYNIKRMFMLPGRVDGRFFKLDANKYLLPHVDNKTQCCINFILNDNPALITIQDIPYTYKQALINTRMSHSVRNGDTDRILFKISIFDVPFDEVKEIMEHQGFLENAETFTQYTL
jgi:hypothetical protein